MKHRKTMITSFAVATAMVSMGVNAATSTDGLNACAQAAVVELGEQQNTTLEYSLSADSKSSNSRMKHRETFHLDIRNPGSNTVVARIDCIVDSRARVRDLIKVPIEGEDAFVRANS